MQHQNHFVAVIRQRATQGGRHDHVGVQLPAGQAVGLGRFDFTMGHAANRPGEDLRGVGAGVQGERQDGAVHRIAKERIQHWLSSYRGQAVYPRVANQQLDIQRCATEQVGVELHRPAHPDIGRDPGYRQRDRHHEAEEDRGTEQPEGHGQPGDVSAVLEQERFPVFLQ
ncbi:hypothetical protein D3C80_1656010 [compost metagenome]